MTFPVLTYALLRVDGKFVDEDFAKWCCRHNMKWADSNFFISKDVTSLSNCCRLVSNVKNLGFFNSIGGSALEVGCFVGYALVFPLTLRFLYTYQISPEITNQLSLDSYMSNFLMLVFMMGIIFELPLVSALLSKIGLLNRSFFKQYRKHAIVVLLIVAAVITPSSDPFTLMAVFLPIYILWEFSAILVKPAPKNED